MARAALRRERQEGHSWRLAGEFQHRPRRGEPDVGQGFGARLDVEGAVGEQQVPGRIATGIVHAHQEAAGRRRDALGETDRHQRSLDDPRGRAGRACDQGVGLPASQHQAGMEQRASDDTLRQLQPGAGACLLVEPREFARDGASRRIEDLDVIALQAEPGRDRRHPGHLPEQDRIDGLVATQNRCCLDNPRILAFRQDDAHGAPGQRVPRPLDGVHVVTCASRRMSRLGQAPGLLASTSPTPAFKRTSPTLARRPRCAALVANSRAL